MSSSRNITSANYAPYHLLHAGRTVYYVSGSGILISQVIIAEVQMHRSIIANTSIDEKARPRYRFQGRDSFVTDENRMFLTYEEAVAYAVELSNV